MDPALDGYPEVWAAAGTPNAVFAIAPATLAMLSDALVAPCAEDVPRRRPRLGAVSEVQRLSVGYPGGLAARYRWGGSGSGEAVFALSESGGALTDHAALAGGDPARMCRAELRVEGPSGPGRRASPRRSSTSLPVSSGMPRPSSSSSTVSSSTAWLVEVVSCAGHSALERPW